MESGSKIFFSTNLLTSRSWVLVVAEAVLAIGIGAFFFSRPLAAAAIMAVIFGVFVLASAIQEFMQLSCNFSGLRLFYAILLLLAGLCLVGNPLFSVVDIVIVLGIWSIFHSIELIAAAVALKNMPGALRSMTAVNGVLALIFGVVLLAFPLASTVWVTYLAAFYLIIYGVIALVLGFRLRKLTRN